MARKVVLAGACRTAIGTMGGTLSTTPAPDLGTVVIKEALKRTGIRPDQVDEVYMGCVIQAGLGQNPARQAAVNAGIPVEVPATTINVLCGSGLHCVNLAAKLIACGDADIIVAGGMENMSKAPYLLYDARFGYRMGAAKMDDALLRDALHDAFGGYHMGITAENVAQSIIQEQRHYLVSVYDTVSKEYYGDCEVLYESSGIIRILNNKIASTMTAYSIVYSFDTTKNSYSRNLYSIKLANANDVNKVSTKVTALETKITELETKNTALETRIAELERIISEIVIKTN